MQEHTPVLVPPPQLGEGSSCRMAPLLFDFGTERQEGPDISTPTLHPLDQTRLVFHPSQRRRGRRTHCPPAAQRPGLSDQPKPCLTLPNLPPFSLLQSWRCGGSRACQGKDVVRLRRPRGTRQGVVAQRGASRSGEDAVDVQGLSPGPPAVQYLDLLSLLVLSSSQWGPPTPPSQPPTPDEEEEDRGRDEEEEEVSGRREERRKTAVSLYSCRGGEEGRGGPSTADSECGRRKAEQRRHRAAVCRCRNYTPPWSGTRWRGGFPWTGGGIGCGWRVFAVVTGLAAAVLELQLWVGAGTGVGALLQYHRRPTGVSVEQQQGLIVAFDTARHHVLPLRADLERYRRYIMKYCTIRPVLAQNLRQE
ncbi:hypothetical protein F7725_014472 [Dissostichus mawsoni]|uniref:Uncharacterized protein n=1 Tax=Dissostichus mawsoni TaxID=36200 RepID=A0A7J5YW06_DISMA|nr:hypothetical protein F7725_014472 [Dissostichus mawsoni]